ncbi:MAG: T9SS type A sorting domain-containing protein [Marinoscillum sp.]
MKKLNNSLSVLLLLCTYFVSAQSWTVYNASVDPLTFDPAFEVTQQTNAVNTIIADPDDASNSLLQMTTAELSDNNQWRQPSTGTDLTIVIKAKSADVSGKNLLFDMDMRNSTAGRYSLRVLTDGTYSVASGGSGSDVLGHDASKWTIYRFTKSGQDIAVYLDENPTPVFTATSESTSDGSDYFRFGDGWGSGNIDTQVDWVTWDFSGAYSPTDSKLPSELTKEPEGNWTVYNADVDPLLFDPAFEVTQQTNAVNTIVSDPDNASNSLLQMTTAELSDNNQWRQPTTATDLTIVIKAKSADVSGKNLLFDMDMRNSTAGRYSLRVLTDGTYSVASGGSGTGTLGHDASKWTIYRVTKSGQDIAVYLDEDPTPVFTATSESTSDGSDYFRFGDGWGSGNIDTQVDWVSWDLTGAYSPSDLKLPSELTETPETPLGEWTVYNADVDPLLFDPAFEVTQQTNAINTIVDDPERAGNKLLQMTTAELSDNNQWRQPTTATDLTIVIKAKSSNVSGKNLLFDMDMRNSTAGRYSLRVLTDGTYSVASGGSGSDVLGHDASKWTIYRFTKSGQDIAVYLDENPTPVFTATSESTSDGSDYFRFGDGWGSGNIDTQVDWVVWDVSGAHAPSETRLPDDLVKAPLGEWTVYEADVDPLTFDPAFEVTQQTNAVNSIVADPDDAGNNLLQMTTAELSDNNQWRQPTTATDLTIVIKAKSADVSGKNLLFDMDMRNSTAGRYSLRVLTDGTYSVASGGSGSDVLGHNASEWTIYRFTKSGQDVKVYLDEDPTPVFTATSESTSDGSDYFRFGDGWGSGNIDTYIDWVVWDLSGAFSPYQTRLPDALTGEGGGEEPTPTISNIGSPDPLSMDVGFASDFTVDSYIVSGKDLKGDLTITPPADFEVSLNQSDWFTATNPMVISPSSGTVDITDIYVRLNATAVGEFSGEISHASTGAEEVKVAVSGTAVNLVPAIALTGTLEAFTQNLSSSSASQNYRVSGDNLKGAITVSAPDNFQVSVDEATWQSEIMLDPTDRSISNAQVFVRLSATALGEYSGNIVHSATDSESVNLAVSGEVIPDPGINVSGELTAFTQSLGRPSSSQSYSISGTNLAGTIVIDLPMGFEISFNDELWLPSLTLAPLEGTLDEITLFVRLNATEVGTKSGDIVHSSGGVDPVSVAVSGTVEAGNVLADLEKMNVEFQLSPNPSTERIMLERKDFSEAGFIVIYNLSGTKVATHSVQSGSQKLGMDVSTLPKGIYLVEYAAGSVKSRLKFIKD